MNLPLCGTESHDSLNQHHLILPRLSLPCCLEMERATAKTNNHSSEWTQCAALHSFWRTKVRRSHLDGYLPMHCPLYEILFPLVYPFNFVQMSTSYQLLVFTQYTLCGSIHANNFKSASIRTIDYTSIHTVNLLKWGLQVRDYISH